MSTEGIDITEAAIVASMLSSDTVPDENQAGKCFACDEPLKGLFCTKCGQKNDNYRRSIFALVIELFGAVFSLESRIWRSWGNLIFRPGRVPREFADGKRSQWSSPVRVYLAMSIILFGFMGVTNTHLASLDVNATINEGVTTPYEELKADDIRTKWGVRFFETQSQIDARNKDRDMHLLEVWLQGSGNKFTPEQRAALETELRDSLEALGEEGNPDLKADLENRLNRLLAVVDEVDTALGATPEVDEPENVPDNERGDVAVDNPVSVDTGGEAEEPGEVYFSLNGEKVTNEQGTRFLINFVKNPVVLTSAFNKWLPRLMFIMMPFTMLLGALFIRDKKRALLFDHLVHAAYIHGIAFFLLFAGIILSKIWPNAPIFPVIFGLLLLYLPLSLKRMFQRGWFKTILTSYTVGFLYLFIIMITMAGLLSWELSKTLGVV